jgi:Spy/CpxP family protein refolding chaperone
MTASKMFWMLLFSVLNIACVFGQSEIDEKQEKFQSQKIAFITNKLKLTPKEAQAFWPVYNEYDSRKQNINQSRLKAVVKFQTEGVIFTEKESAELADQYIILQKQEALLAEEFNAKFKSVLPASKVLKLYQAELQFKRELLKLLKQSRSDKKRIAD